MTCEQFVDLRFSEDFEELKEYIEERTAAVCPNRKAQDKLKAEIWLWITCAPELRDLAGFQQIVDHVIRSRSRYRKEKQDRLGKDVYYYRLALGVGKIPRTG